MTWPPYECPARTVGPLWRLSTWRTLATSSASEVSGSWTAVTWYPSASRRSMTSLQQDPSAQAPWTRTMFGDAAIRRSFRWAQAEPVVEARRRDTCVVAGDEGVVVQFGAEVAGADVGHHPSRVAARAEDTSRELVEGERFGADQLDRVVQRRTDRHIRQRGGDVIGGGGIDQGGREPHGIAVGVRIGDLADNLEGLGRPDDRVRDRPGLHHFLPRELR